MDYSCFLNCIERSVIKFQSLGRTQIIMTLIKDRKVINDASWTHLFNPLENQLIEPSIHNALIIRQECSPNIIAFWSWMLISSYFYHEEQLFVDRFDKDQITYWLKKELMFGIVLFTTFFNCNWKNWDDNFLKNYPHIYDYVFVMVASFMIQSLNVIQNCFWSWLC